MFGKVALIFDSGKILDATAEEGIYSFDSSTSPSLFAGQFGEMFKEMWERFKFNGTPSKEQAIFYINTKEIIGNKFGSSSPMAYPDPEYFAGSAQSGKRWLAHQRGDGRLFLDYQTASC